MAGVPTYAEMLATVEKRGDAELALLAKYGFLLEPLGDDGDIYLAHGHVPPDRFLEAWREWARAVWGLTQQDIDDFGPAPRGTSSTCNSRSARTGRIAWSGPLLPLG